MQRVLPWVPLAVALAACEPSPPRASEPSSRPSGVPPVTTAPVVAAPAEDGGAGPADLAGPVPEAALAEDVRNANGFTLSLLSRTSKTGENGMISGTSVRHAVGAAYLGAHGVTAREMASALQLDDDPLLAARLARAELAAWQEARGSAALDVANRLWVGEGFAIRPAFQKTAEQAYGADAEGVAFTKPEDARGTINAWVSGKTQGKIPDLLPPGAVDPDPRFVITNAIWFKGSWQLPFPKERTKDEAFKLDAKKSVKVPMMGATDMFRFGEAGGVKVLELRYEGSQLTMLVVLPGDVGGLAKLESGLDAGKLDAWAAALATARVNVSLPRFTFRSATTLRAPLEALGMKTAFTDKADFSGIAPTDGGGPLFIGQIFHETFISVDEAGTEAAAATGAVMRTTSLYTGPTVDFRADHPFLFFLRDAQSGRVLFAGRVADPKAP